MKSKKVEVKPGSKQFDAMSFKLEHAVNASNIDNLDFMKHKLIHIQKDVYVMPVYITKNLNLILVAAPFVEGDWTIAFSKADITTTPQGQNEVTDMSSPMPAGEGLNLLGQYSPNLSNRLLSYFRTLSQAKLGSWHLINTKGTPNK